MGQMKTPGVYIVEKNAFPNSVVEVATAVPAFIGYTEKADNRGKSLSNKPWRITSMAEFHNYYGFAPAAQFKIDKKTDKNAEADFAQGSDEYLLSQTAGNYLLYRCMLMFFQNGGGPCYIVSVGSYGDDVEADKLQKGIDPLIKEQEPTMVVIPDAMLLKEPDCISTQQAMLAHCGGKMKSRVAVLDIWGGARDRQDPSGDCIENFRSALGINYLDFAAAYYPWVNTTIVQDNDLNFENIANKDVLQNLLRSEAGMPDIIDKDTPPKVAQQFQAINDITDLDGATAEKPKDDKTKGDKTRAGPADTGGGDEDLAARKALLNKSLVAMSPLFGNILGAIKCRQLRPWPGFTPWSTIRAACGRRRPTSA
jgi:hypothetical protein